MLRDTEYMMGVMGCVHKLNSRMFYTAKLGCILFSQACSHDARRTRSQYHPEVRIQFAALEQWYLSHIGNTFDHFLYSRVNFRARVRGPRPCHEVACKYFGAVEKDIGLAEFKVERQMCHELARRQRLTQVAQGGPTSNRKFLISHGFPVIFFFRGPDRLGEGEWPH
jgi:hypothetical protein